MFNLFKVCTGTPYLVWPTDEFLGLESYDYTSLGGYVIPIQLMTSYWSYFEFSHQFILMVIV